MERASSGESFTGGAMREREVSKERARYAAGTGSNYPGRYEGPMERASTGEPFTGGGTFREGGMEPPREMTPVERGRAGMYPSQEPAPTSKTGAKVVATGAMVKEKGQGYVEKGKEYGQQATGKAKEYTETHKSEDMAKDAGETIGRAIRKAAVIVGGLTSGRRKGLGREKERMPEEQARQEGAVSETERYREEPVQKEAVERETYVSEAPEGTQKATREVRKKESQ
jgi:hypothetical protein